MFDAFKCAKVFQVAEKENIAEKDAREWLASKGVDALTVEIGYWIWGVEKDVGESIRIIKIILSKLK